MEQEHEIVSTASADEEIDAETWLQKPGETSEAFAAFSAYLDLGPRRSIDAAYRKHLSKTRELPVGEITLRACGRWNTWSVIHRWRERAFAFDKRSQRIVHQSREWLTACAGISWYSEQQEDIRECLEIYKNLRRGLLALTAGGLVTDNSIKRSVQTEDGQWISDEQRLRIADQFRIMNELRSSLFPTGNMMVTDEYGNQWSRFTPPDHILVAGEQEADSAAKGAAGEGLG